MYAEWKVLTDAELAKQAERLSLLEQRGSLQGQCAGAAVCMGAAAYGGRLENAVLAQAALAHAARGGGGCYYKPR